MTLVYLGVSLPNYVKNPLKDKLSFCSAEELRRVKISHEEYCAFLTELKKIDYVEEATLVATCNRFEVILHVPKRYASLDQIYEVMTLISKLSGKYIPLNFLVDRDARLQILRTFCGLNSGLIGEDEISAQMRASFKQSIKMGFAGDCTQELLDSALRLREKLNTEVYKDYKVSYCELAIEKSLEKFKILPRDLVDLEKIVVLGSGNTTKNSCLSLIKLGAKAESITVIHRVSKSSAHIESFKAEPELEDLNFIRAKDGYHIEKSVKLMEIADLVIFGIDSKRPVIKFGRDYKTKIIDFNSNSSCYFEPGFDFRNYVSTFEADDFVRAFAFEQIQRDEFVSKIKLAERLIKLSTREKVLSATAAG